jgi:hypothetical protein
VEQWIIKTFFPLFLEHGFHLEQLILLIRLLFLFVVLLNLTELILVLTIAPGLLVIL